MFLGGKLVSAGDRVDELAWRYSRVLVPYERWKVGCGQGHAVRSGRHSEEADGSPTGSGLGK